MINAGTHGAVTWIDLSTSDVEAAASFYRELLGWTDVEVSSTPMGDYYMGKLGDFQVCGMMAQGPELAGAPAMWTVFVYVDDVDATAAKVGDAGGTVLTQPFDIPEARIAVIADPSGAVFGLFGGPQIDGEFYSQDFGRVCWVELMSRDPDSVKDFYADLFGWETVVEHVATTGSDYVWFKIGDEPVAGMMAMPGEIPQEVPSYWSAYFSVEDCSISGKAVIEMGGEVYVSTMSIGDGKFATFADPQGATFNVFQYEA